PVSFSPGNGPTLTDKGSLRCLGFVDCSKGWNLNELIDGEIMRTSHRRCFRAGSASCFLIMLLAPGAIDAAKLQTGDSRHPQSGSSSKSQIIAKPDRQAASLLEPGKPIERTLTGVETHGYELRLQKGQCAVIHVEQRGINVVVQLLGSDKDSL